MAFKTLTEINDIVSQISGIPANAEVQTFRSPDGMSLQIQINIPLTPDNVTIGSIFVDKGWTTSEFYPTEDELWLPSFYEVIGFTDSGMVKMRALSQEENKENKTTIPVAGEYLMGDSTRIRYSSLYTDKVYGQFATIEENCYLTLWDGTPQFCGFKYTIKDRYPEGARVRLFSSANPNAPKRGTKGTIISVDENEIVQIEWDNGKVVGMNPKTDRFTKL